ncbi:MAG: ABC transporter permease [Candidatus Bathyarchaeia archaeon]
MLKYLVKRLLVLLPTLFGVVTLVFFIIRLTPGDPAQLILGEFATPETLVLVRERLGLNRPLHVQYFTFLYDAFRGDFGRSFRTGRNVMEVVLQYLPYTLQLAVAAVIISTSIGMLVGILSAKHRNSAVDYLSSVLGLLGVSMPNFWLGILLLWLFALNLRLFPVIGSGAGGNPLKALHYLILPAFTLGISTAALTIRMTRSCMLEVLNQDYIRTARAKGVPEGPVVYNHALRNALIPVVTIVGLNFGRLMGGTVLIETVFTRPGLGMILVNAIFARDYPQVQACTIFYAFAFMIVNLLVDVLYAYLDPRIKYG